MASSGTVGGHGQIVSNAARASTGGHHSLLFTSSREPRHSETRCSYILTNQKLSTTNRKLTERGGAWVLPVGPQQVWVASGGARHHGGDRAHRARAVYPDAKSTADLRLLTEPVHSDTFPGLAVILGHSGRVIAL